MTEEYRILDTLNYEVTTFTPTDCVRLFETRFSLNVEHLRQRFPQRTGSWLSLLARVLSEVIAGTALLLARDFVRDLSLSMESTVWFLSCLAWVSLLLSGVLNVKPRWLGPPPSTRVLLLFPRLPSLAFEAGNFLQLFPSLLGLDHSSDVGCHSVCRVKKKNCHHEDQGCRSATAEVFRVQWWICLSLSVHSSVVDLEDKSGPTIGHITLRNWPLRGWNDGIRSDAILERSITVNLLSEP